MQVTQSEKLGVVIDQGKWREIISTSSTGPKPQLPDYSLRNDPMTTIYIAIASYRDVRCGRTLFNIFTKATRPEMIFVGVIDQLMMGDTPDKSCVTVYCELMSESKNFNSCPYLDNIHEIRISYLESRGPTYGRSFQTALLTDEDFCMQIDSHMDFVTGFDDIALESWYSAQDEYAILSTYPHNISLLDDLERKAKLNLTKLHSPIPQQQVARICKYETGQHGMIRFRRATLAQLSRPAPQAGWAAGFSFSKCHLMRNVPYDPYLPQLFDGEEFSFFARAWTSGYNVYTPHLNLIYHDYTFSLAIQGKRWKHDESVLKASHDRLWNVLKQEGNLLNRYGLGRRRSMSQFMEYAGIEYLNIIPRNDSRKMRKWIVTKNTCGWLDYVPCNDDHDEDDEFVFGQAKVKISNSPTLLPIKFKQI